MIVCRVIGQAISTVKDESLRAGTLLIVSPCDLTGAATDAPALVALDTVGAGEGEVVIVATGSAARQVARGVNGPLDAAVVGIVDSLTVEGARSFTK